VVQNNGQNNGQNKAAVQSDNLRAMTELPVTRRRSGAKYPLLHRPTQQTTEAHIVDNADIAI
jgi:hypothetical protein